MKAELLYIQKLTYDENTGNEIIGLFPSEYNPAIVSSYTYDAKRMGGAPTITATIYSSDPLQWKKEEFVEYNGDRFFASYTPNSTKDNSSRMWKSEITFTSRRELLDNTLFFDVVVDDVDTQNKDRYRSNQTKFTFGGTIYEFVDRINSSMAYCGLYRPTDEYKGYYVVVDEGYGTDEVKEVSFEDQYLTDVLQLINTTFELDYYWDGNVCHVGKVQHDLTDTPIKYGSSDALISVSKENANYKIVDMITGYGSSDNLPYYYPNDDEFGKADYSAVNFDKSLVKDVDLSKIFSWCGGEAYNKKITLCKNTESKYSANIIGNSPVFTRTFGGLSTVGLTDADKTTYPQITTTVDGASASFYLGYIRWKGTNGSQNSSRSDGFVIASIFELDEKPVEGSIEFSNLKYDVTLKKTFKTQLSSVEEETTLAKLDFTYEYYLYVGEDMKLEKCKEWLKSITLGGYVGDKNHFALGDSIPNMTQYKINDKCPMIINGKCCVLVFCRISTKTGDGHTLAEIKPTGSIDYIYEPNTTQYYWSSSDNKSVAIGNSGIDVDERLYDNAISANYTLQNGAWVAIGVSGSTNAPSIVINGRIYTTPSQNLMPSIYRESGGSERFYYAKNDTYLIPGTSDHYKFVNLYKKGNPHQGSVTFDDIKPTINGIVNAEGHLFGEIADVSFDKEDSDVKDSDGNYIHSYFYIKLHKFNGDFGFDLFNHVLAKEPAKINLIKSNGCPACSFVIHNQPSADNSKCYNCVSVDENGNLKQVRTDKNDYIFDNASDAYEDNLNQDSTHKELWIAVQKDTSTLGIIMPNASAGFKPQKGDLFVITGIKPPKVLITAAEKRLDDALIKHMSENNTDQFNYSVKFSRIFLQENPDFASKLNENAKLSIQIQGDSDSDGNLISHEVFVSNYSVKVDNDELAEVEVELVNSLEVTKSDVKQIIDSVKGETVKSLSSMVGGNNTNNFNASITDKMYISKLKDDIANGKITFIKGLIAKALADLAMGAKFGNNAKITEFGEAVFSAIKSLDYDNAAEQGFSVEKEKNGKYHAFVTNLTIWGKAIFHELEVRKLSYSGGNIYLSVAGSKLIKVVPVKQSVSNGVATWVETTEDDAECVGWKCYLLADNGTTATMNYWQEGDQVRCQTIGEIVAGGAYSDVSNKSYWRTIPKCGVSTQNEKIYGKKKETYLDEDGNEQTRDIQVELYDGQAFAWIVIGKHCGDIDGYDDEFSSVGYNGSNPAPLETRDIPSAGDTIVLDGNRHRNKQGEYDKTDRQNVIILETTGEYAPRIACYANITEYKHTFTKSVNGNNKEVSLSVFETSPKGGTKINSSRFEWISDDGSTINIINYRGDWVSDNTYHKNDQVNYNNAVWVCVANSGVDVTEEPSDGATYWKKVLSGGKGDKGDDGKTPQPTGSAELYYAITSSPSAEPSSWTITPIDTSKYQGKFLWTDNRTEWKIGDKTEWISNKTCSYIGKDGANGTSVSIKGSLSDIGELPVSGNVNGDSYLIDGYLWIYTGTSVDDDNHYNGFENVGKIKGEDGISATQYYYHVAWMNTSDNSDNSFTNTNPSGSSYAYIGTLIDTTEKDSDDYTKYDWVYVKGDRGDDGKNAVRIDLTNESSTVTCDKDGNIIGTIQGTVAILYDGAKEADINMVSYSISSYKGLSSMPTISEGGVISDLSVSGGKTSLEASINIKAVYKNQDYYATYTITKVLAGSDGTPATTYWIEPSATAIKVDSDGNANPSTITCNQYKQVGAESPVAGDKKIYYRHNAIDSTLWKEYTEAIIPAVNVEAYEFVLADSLPSISSDIIYDRESIPVVKDGQNGNDGLSGNGIVPAYIRSKDNPTPPTSTDKNNLDNGWSLAIPSVADIPLWQSNGKEVFTREDSGAKKSKIESWSEPFKVTGENGTDGKDAYRVVVSPSVLIFDTDDNGIVAKSSLSKKTATIRVYQGDKDVSNQFSKYDTFPSNYYNCYGSLKDLNKYPLEIQVTEIEKQVVTDTAESESEISKTNGFLEFFLTNGSANVTAHVDVQVNVAKFTGQMVNTNKRFSKTLQEVSNRVDDKVGSSDLTQFKSEITQTAREISLSVSEKSIERRNLLVGSAFLREDNHYTLSRDTRIEMNSGYKGTNCVKVIDDTDGTSHYIGVYWDGSQGGRSVKIEKGKKYTISCYYKTNDSNAKFSLEAIYTDKETNAKRLGRPKFLSPNFFNPKYNQWELFTTVIDTTDAESDYIAFNFWEYCNVEAGRINAYICRPMVEEGDTYNGWTLSKDDYDIIGANLIDNSRTLDAGGNVFEAKGQKSLVGDAYELTYIGSDDYNTFYQIKGSTFKLNTDYTISFEVRGDAKYMGVYAYYPITNTKFTLYAEPQNGAMTEVTDGGKVNNYVALIQVEELSKQQRVWSHFRFKDRLPEKIYFQFPKNTDQIGVTSWSVTITRPKIEVGAVITEYTERKSDLVDKASLKKAGIGITDREVLLYGEKVKVMNGNAVAALFKDGMLNADLIAAKVLESLGSNGARVSISDGMMEFFGSVNKTMPNIRFGLNSEGSAVLSYYDNNGDLLYDLGPDGISTMDKTNGSFTAYQFYTSQNLFGVSSTPSSYGTYKTFTSSHNPPSISETFLVADNSYDSHLFPILNPSTDTKTTLYRYTAPRINGKIVADSLNGFTTQELASKADGKYFTSKAKADVVKNGNLASLAPDGDYWNVNTGVVNQGNFQPAVLKLGEYYDKPTYSRALPMSLFAGSKELGIVGKICSKETTRQWGQGIIA